jgi:GDSL-like Lipase/Acylhydrolase family
LKANSSPSPATRMRLVLGIAGIIAGCVFVEGALRVSAHLLQEAQRRELNAQDTPPGTQWAIYDPDLLFRQNPGFGDFNTDGLRDRPIGPKSGRFRLVMLGDSIAAMGENVDDTFVAYMRDALKAVPGSQHLDVVNASTFGYTNYQEIVYLKKYGLKFEPDLVGVEFCLNDLHKFQSAMHAENGHLVGGVYGEARTSRGWMGRLVSSSYLLSWMRRGFRNARNHIRLLASGGYSFDLNPGISNAWEDAAWQQIENQLSELAAMGREHHFREFVAIFPTAAQYDGAYLARDRGYVLKPQRKLKLICNRLGIFFIDMYPYLSRDLLLPDQSHLTKQGRVVGGRGLANALRGSGLLPGAGDTGAK